MKQLHSQDELEAWRQSLPAQAELVLVPTMGALHRGHQSLLEAALAMGQPVLTSIFVNPLQFERADDLQHYPRTLDADLQLLESLGVAAVYLPAANDIVPAGLQVGLDPGPVGSVLEGAARPGHFAGMLTIVHKLFQRCQPQHAWFGEKDAQQLFLVRRMVADLDLRVKIHACPTYREQDGLAYSSRNARLDTQARKEALLLSRALFAAGDAFVQGCQQPRQLEELMRAMFADSPLQLAYAAVVRECDFAPAEAGDGEDWRALIAARIQGIHLLDNLRLTTSV